MSGWESKRLSEVFEIKPPKTVPRDKFSPNTVVSFLPMEDLGILDREIKPTKTKRLAEVTTSSYTFFAEDDVLLAKITPCFENGKLGIAKNLTNKVGFGSSEYIVFRKTGIVLPEYLFYFLANEEFRDEAARTMSGAVGHKRLSKEFVENYVIPYPITLPEQLRIVSILDEAFAAIAKAKANTEKNLQNTKELFESYLNGVFENGGKDWDEKPFGEVCELVGGSQPPKDDFVYKPSENYIRLIQVRDYRTEKYATYIPKAKAKRFCSKDDIMIGRYGPPIFGIFRGLEGSYNVALMKAVPNNRLLLSDYFFWFLNNRRIKTFVEVSSKRAAGQDGVRKELLAEYPVPIPSKAVQQQLINSIEVLRKQAQKLEAHYQQKLTSLEELKKSLLKKAFRGELTEKEVVV